MLGQKYNKMCWLLRGMLTPIKHGNRFYVNGKIHCKSPYGHITFGNSCQLNGNFGKPLMFQTKDKGKIIVGDRVLINRGTWIHSTLSVRIDDDARIAPDCFIADDNFHRVLDEPVKKAPIHIKKNAWIGTKTVILPGVTIGENAVVGANSVVTRDVPDNTFAAGSPAKKIRGR